MPNWCSNYLEIHASPEAIDQLLTKAKAPPCPDSQEIVEFSFLPFVEHLIPENEDAFNTNCNLIGCKWFPDLNHIDREEDSVLLSFETPWSPSENATRHLASWLQQIDPQCQIIHSYEECGMAFCGILTITADGETHDQGDYFEIECNEVGYSDDSDLEYITEHFEITTGEIRKQAQACAEYGYLAFYPKFFEGYGSSSASLYLSERTKQAEDS